MTLLADLLEITPGDVLALAGAGGKTTLLFRLAEELRGRHRVLTTTTTKLARDETPLHGVVIGPDNEAVEACCAAWREGKTPLLVGESHGPDRFAGPRADVLAAASAKADIVLVEADGARRRPLKIPRPGEPVLPLGTNRVLVVYGADAFDAELGEENVHRLKPASPLFGKTLTPDLFRSLVLTKGYLGLPCRLDLVVHKADEGPRRLRARTFGRWAFSRRWERILITDRTGLAVPIDNRSHRVALVVAAAGAASRFQGPKLAADAKGRSLLERTLAATQSSQFHRTVLVVGEGREHVLRALPDEVLANLLVAVNPDPSRGLSSSLRVGLEACADSDAVAFVLGDMPWVGPELTSRVMAAYRASAARICAPRVGDRTGHPVVFSKELFGALGEITGDTGARDVIKENLTWARFVDADPETQRDVDRPEDLAGPF